MKCVSGKAVAPGIAIGKLQLFRKNSLSAARVYVKDSAAEIRRAEAAFDRALSELSLICEKSRETFGPDCAEIFEAHRQLLSDADYLEAIRGIILSEHVGAAYAAELAGAHFSQMLEQTDDAYLRERAADIRDISERLVRILTEQEEEKTQTEDGAAQEGSDGGTTELRQEDKPKEAADQTLDKAPDEDGVILAAVSLSPSETVQLDRTRIRAFITEQGSENSHTAILARMMGIPAVTGISLLPLRNAKNAEGITVIVEGGCGEVIFSPDAETLSVYRKRQADEQRKREALGSLRGKPAQTRSGKRIGIYANAGTLQDVKAAFENDAEGIGLLRTEFLFLDRMVCPTEEEQFLAYRAAAQTAGGRTLVIRTLDLGADKRPPFLPFSHEENPALGLRGIRLSLANRDMFRVQLRALLRAAAYGKISVLYPMISDVSELREARKIATEAERELLEEGISFGSIQQGVMIETPAAALSAEKLIGEADFFSIGTNDLTQYTLAVDRMGGAALEPFYSTRHEAVLKLIRMSTQAARNAGKRTEICGELALDRELTPFFLEIGIDALSVAPPEILPMRGYIRGMD